MSEARFRAVCTTGGFTSTKASETCFQGDNERVRVKVTRVGMVLGTSHFAATYLWCDSRVLSSLEYRIHVSIDDIHAQLERFGARNRYSPVLLPCVLTSCLLLEASCHVGGRCGRCTESCPISSQTTLILRYELVAVT